MPPIKFTDIEEKNAEGIHLLVHKEGGLILRTEPQFSIVPCALLTVLSHTLQVLLYLPFSNYFLKRILDS